MELFCFHMAPVVMYKQAERRRNDEGYLARE